MLTTPPATARASRRCQVPLAIMAATAAGLLTACASSSTHQTAPTPGGGATSAGQTSAAATPAAPGATSPAPPELAGLARCQSASLTITVNASQAGGAAGSIYYPVDFTNTSSSPCGMYGYPGMSFVTAGSSTGRQIGAAAQQNPSFGKVAVRLAAGGVAHAWLQVAEAGNYPASACRPVTAHWLRVFAPGQTVARYVNHAFGACSSSSSPLLTVMPVRAGRGVQGTAP